MPPQEQAGAPGPAEDNEVLNLEQAIAFLQTTRPTFYRWLAQGKVQGFKAGRQWRFYRRDLRKFLEFDDPAAVGVDLAAVRAAIRTLDERIARVRAARGKGAGR